MRKTLLSLAVLAALAVPSFAQRITATIRGTVTDGTGAVVPGAGVTVKGEVTGYTRSTLTNAAGVYSFPEMPVGTYAVEVTLTGFKSSVTRGISLNVADDRSVNVRLETGTLSENVTVEVPAVAVKTIGGEIAGLVTGEQVRELPLNGRNFLQLGTLMPGVSQGDGFDTKNRGLMSHIQLAVSGSGQAHNLWTVDGANNNDVGSNATILVFPSVDAIEEFKVHRNSYGAEFGGASGAQINIVTRGGTNDFHGSAYYFGRNDSLASTEYFLKQAGRPKGPLSVHDFGATIGGPIIKDKVHFFLSRNGTARSAASRAARSCPPRPSARATSAGPRSPAAPRPRPSTRSPSSRSPATAFPRTGSRRPGSW